MQQNGSDPRMPFVVGMIVLGVILTGGIIWAVLSAPAISGPQGNPNLTFNDANDPALGPENAPIVIRAFEDLECPACRGAKAGVDAMLAKYGDRVRFIWNDFPLPPATHPNARVAANAARCAEEQGKFWEMADLLYAEQSSWSKAGDVGASFRTYANRIGLDEQGFRACYDSRRHDNKIADDLAEGRANGVNSTPTFFVNNVMYAGSLSAAQWDKILEPLLQNTPLPPSETPAPETLPATE